MNYDLHSKQILTRFAICLALAFVDQTCASAVTPWKLGDSWHLEVEVLSRQSKDKEISRYNMHVVVLGSERIEENGCTKFDFIIPEGQTPAGLTSRWRVSVDTLDGWPRQGYSFGDYREVPILVLGKSRVLKSHPEGFPIEFFPLVGPFEETAGNDRISLSQDKVTGVRSAIIDSGESPEVEIRQTWKKGELWWRSYERFRNGKLELRASLVIPVVSKNEEVESQPEVETEKELPSAPFVDRTNDPLTTDPRLQVKLSLNLVSPGPSNLLALLQEATRLSFSLDSSINPNKVVFSNVSWQNVPAWAVMHEIADSPSVQGRWESQAGGYRLVAKTGSVGNFGIRGWTWLFLVSVLALGALLFIRRRNRGAQSITDT